MSEPAAYDRARPYPARIVDKRALTGPGSERRTLHVALSIAGAGFPIEPGDVIGVVPRNDPALVAQLLRAQGLEGDRALAAALGERFGLGMPPLKLLRAAVDRLGDDEAAALEDLCDDDAALDAYLRERDLLDFFAEHPSLRFSADELVRLLPALQPRTYSVASSRAAHPDEVHLTVGITRWERAGRERIGVASAHLERAAVGEALPIYWQASPHFRMPADPAAPLVCIGPGTGIAPFRGFLQARAATGGGAVWIVFGARTRAHDFYYRDELEGLRARGALARLDLAFSRDQPERVYVQHRLREAGPELGAWIDRGAHVYLCGDAAQMAPAVEAALGELLGAPRLAELRQAGRFHRDVY